MVIFLNCHNLLPPLPSCPLPPARLFSTQQPEWSRWNDIKISIFCPNPSHGSHFTQSKSCNSYIGHKEPWLGPHWLISCPFSQCSVYSSHTRASSPASSHLRTFPHPLPFALPRNPGACTSLLSSQMLLTILLKLQHAFFLTPFPDPAWFFST